MSSVENFTQSAKRQQVLTELLTVQCLVKLLLWSTLIWLCSRCSWGCEYLHVG